METRSRSGPGWVAGCHGDSDGDVFAMGFCLAASTKYEIQKTTKLQAPHTSSDSNMTHKIPAIHALHSKKNPITWLWCSLTHSSYIYFIRSFLWNNLFFISLIQIQQRSTNIYIAEWSHLLDLNHQSSSFSSLIEITMQRRKVYINLNVLNLNSFALVVKINIKNTEWINRGPIIKSLSILDVKLICISTFTFLFRWV